MLQKGTIEYLRNEEIEAYLQEAKLQLENEEVNENLLFDPDSFPLNSTQYLYILDYAKNEVYYHRNMDKVLGYKEEDIHILLFEQYLIPSQKRILRGIVNTAIYLGLNGAVKNETELNLIYKVRTKEGITKTVLRRSGMFQESETGKLIKAFNVVTDLSEMMNTDNVEFHFVGRNFNNDEFRAIISKNLMGLFSEREHEILRLLDGGKTSKQIGDNLCISSHTVDTHRRNILKKSGCQNTRELIDYYRNILSI